MFSPFSPSCENRRTDSTPTINNVYRHSKFNSKFVYNTRAGAGVRDPLRGHGPLHGPEGVAAHRCVNLVSLLPPLSSDKSRLDVSTLGA